MIPASTVIMEKDGRTQLSSTVFYARKQGIEMLVGHPNLAVDVVCNLNATDADVQC